MLAYASSNPKVFAAGDMRRGQSLVVWAIRKARGSAPRSAHRQPRGMRPGTLLSGTLLDIWARDRYILDAKSPPFSELPPYGVRARFRRE
jgi:hypothetical protein